MANKKKAKVEPKTPEVEEVKAVQVPEVPARKKPWQER